MNRSLGIISGAIVSATLLAGAVGLANRPAHPGQAGPSDRPSTAVSESLAAASPSPITPVNAAVAAVAASPAVCASSSGGSAASGSLTAVRASHHAGYDRVVFEFAGALPGYSLAPQDSSQFVRDASGQAITLRGSAGIRVVFHNASSFPSYRGSADLQPTLPVVREIARTGDFERVLSWGIGLNGTVCAHVAELANPARLVIDVPTPDAAG